jgi:hypothetical protein
MIENVKFAKVIVNQTTIAMKVYHVSLGIQKHPVKEYLCLDVRLIPNNYLPKIFVTTPPWLHVKII